MINNNNFDVIVVGAGIAGSNAAFECASKKIKTLIINISMDNPSFLKYGSNIDLVKKEKLLSELFSSNNLFKKAVLNNLKAICLNNEEKITDYIIDKRNISLYIKSKLETKNNLFTRQGLADEIIKNSDETYSIYLNDGQRYNANAVIIATGTFLKSSIKYGLTEKEAGRLGEITSNSFYKSLKKLNLKFNGITTKIMPVINFTKLPKHLKEGIKIIGRDQLAAFEKTNEFKISEYLNNKKTNFYKYGFLMINTLKEFNENSKNNITYLKDNDKCSLNKNKNEIIKLIPEDIKVKTFYLEWEKFTDNEENNYELLSKYINFENSYFVTENYTIKYKCLSAGQLNNCLESIDNEGLFFAGDINASSGYEEAAYQGYIVGEKALQYLNNENIKSQNISEIENNFIKYVNSKDRKETFNYFDIDNYK